MPPTDLASKKKEDESLKYWGATKHRGSILASHPAALVLIPSIHKNFSLAVVEIH